MSGPPLAPLAVLPPDLRTLLDYERRARDHIAPDTWRHIQSGDGIETTIARNRSQFDSYRLVPRMLTDLAAATTEIELFGLRHAAPILLAPVAYHRLVHPHGELATIGAATALDTTMVASTLSSVPLEDIAEQARRGAAELGSAVPPLWFQLYFQPDRADTATLVHRAEDAGYQAIVFTVDAPVKHAGFPLPDGVRAANLQGMRGLRQTARAQEGRIIFGTPLLAAAPTWQDLAWLRAATRLPIIVKGLLSPADVGLALDHGADGIVVSNHGGRVVDGLASPMDVLPAMIAAAAGRVPVLMDGGVRTGTDVLKALALGARAVLLGRPQLHALAVGGVQGVAHMVHILRAELELAMAAVGRPTCALVNDNLLIS